MSLEAWPVVARSVVASVSIAAEASLASTIVPPSSVSAVLSLVSFGPVGGTLVSSLGAVVACSGDGFGLVDRDPFPQCPHYLLRGTFLDPFAEGCPCEVVHVGDFLEV